MLKIKGRKFDPKERKLRFTRRCAKLYVLSEGQAHKT